MMRLAAQDAEDLTILSARLQDAAAKLSGFVYKGKQRRFAAMVNRLEWEKGGKTRVRAGLHFDSVLGVKTRNVKLGAKDAVISILAITFTPNAVDDPAGVIEIVLAGDGAIRLEVECIDAELADVTRPWTARATPDHGASSSDKN
ncbi:MAG TPA: DUF2948 family protein [Rhizomicrobium sp.]|nr:DUF2948 family protein [Rhizomicrobium sp.]